MGLLDVLDRLEALLEQERLAIRSIDADSVVAIADEKLSLLEALRGGDWASAEEARRRFRALVPSLRENGVLLLHARNTSRDLVQALTSTRASTYDAAGVAVVAVTGRRVSLDA